ncbi:unnamed protein product [Rhizophagus irregularis]|nr:unnamed protein product [Rhizophagus irregularis]
MVKQKRRNNNNTNTFNSKRARHEEIVEEEIEEERIEGESRIEEIRIEDDDEEEGKEIEETENSDAESFEDSEVQDNKSEDQTNKDKKERSFVWLHFEKFKDNYGINWAKCKYCNKVKYKMNGKTCGSMGNLSKHLENHLDKIDPSTRKQAKFIKKFLSEDNDEKTVNI